MRVFEKKEQMQPDWVCCKALLDKSYV